LYDYQATRAGTHAANFLQGFSGHLQVDGYAGYHALASEHCILVGFKGGIFSVITQGKN
jgi:hypothetical protein